MAPTTRTHADLIRDAAARFAAAGLDTPRLDAEVLLRHLLGIDRAALLATMRDPMPDGIEELYEPLIRRRLAGDPVAYLVGVKEFMGRPFTVGPGVLVPRPETELLVEWAERRLPPDADALVVDVGTGSGAIILSLAARASQRTRFIGCDHSAEALAYATRNRADLGLTGLVDLVRGDLLTWLGRPAALILANLPYLRPGQVIGNADLAAEPERALLAGADGLDAIRRLIADLPRTLAPGGSIILELDPSQPGAVAELITRALPGAGVETHQDLAGLDRFVTATR